MDQVADSHSPTRRWRPLERIERRVLGVLAEKAKTTPDAYPLSLNAVVTGSNQKSNRFPMMTLNEGQASDALDSLRKAGAVALVQGDSRVERYRHMLYDWLGVDKAELAVMTELLLRGAQTLGELRGRAARMEPFADLGALLPVVDSLKAKELLLYLTPPGRGAIVTHNLYQPQELAKVKAEAVAGPADAAVAYEPPPRPSAAAPHAMASAAATPHAGPAAASPAEIDAVKQELAIFRVEINEKIASLQSELDRLKSLWEG